ncbi:MAG: hypothetical protein BV459_06815 [Thermoplasmata archaeon M11B2D]|nr:MAG: hypothetical protein BV459_06815 [Thermoplasmata archaeon M11B2D]
MKIEQVALDPQIQEILAKQGITELYPPQADALPYALRGEHVVLSIPTAAGKSLVAYLTIVQRLTHEGGKALYIVPLRALAREKYEDLKAFTSLGITIGISTGDLDESDVRLSKYDVIVCTSEKADSLLRHGLQWLDKIRVLVIDEVHLIHDPTRGPALEVIIAQIKARNPATQLIALSATIKNAVELADWLGGKLVSSNWRPVVLKEGVFFQNTIKYNDGSTKCITGDTKQALELLVQESVNDRGQTLVFVNNRKSTVSLANRLSPIVARLLTEADKKDLKKLVHSIKHEQPEVVGIEQTLVQNVEHGVAFHHAGLESSHRRLVEQGFKGHLIKCIIATPTLAAGVNIPARRVIIRDLWRYDENFGMTPIPILEYKQQAGRAGRPRYDTVGEAITIAKDGNQRDQIFYNYILADTEPIYSKLGSQAALRMHLLAAVATQFVHNTEEMYRFIQSTFYAYQTNEFTIEKEVDEAIEFLLEHQFIEQTNTGYVSTLFGSRTSSLYIDPLSAIRLKTALERSTTKQTTSLSFLHAVCSTPDVRSLYLRGVDSWVEEKADRMKQSLLLDIPLASTDEYEWFLSDLKTAFLLEDWIEEKSYDFLVQKYTIWPGDVHTLVERVEWLLHATREFARMYNFSSVTDLTNLLVRVQNGCKEELLSLISLKGIGRVRARALYREGFKTINDLRGVPLERLAKIKMIGKTVAKNIKQQLGEDDLSGNTTLRRSKR